MNPCFLMGYSNRPSISANNIFQGMFSGLKIVWICHCRTLVTFCTSVQRVCYGHQGQKEKKRRNKSSLRICLGFYSQNRSLNIQNCTWWLSDILTNLSFFLFLLLE